VPWRFLDAGQLSVRGVSVLPASKTQHISGLLHRGKQRALFDQLVGAIEQLSWDSEAA
jgi:hypothetical protein